MGLKGGGEERGRERERIREKERERETGRGREGEKGPQVSFWRRMGDEIQGQTRALSQCQSKADSLHVGTVEGERVSE